MLKIRLTETAQKAAYLANLPAARELEFEVPPGLIDRFFALGGRLDDAGKPTLNATRWSALVSNYQGAQGYLELDAPCKDALAAIEALERELAAVQTAREQKRAAALRAQREHDEAYERWLVEWPVERLVERMRRGDDIKSPIAYGHGDSEVAQKVRDRITEATDTLFASIHVEPMRLCQKQDIDDNYRRWRVVYRYGQNKVDVGDAVVTPDALFANRPDVWDTVGDACDAANREHIAELRAWVAVAFADDPTALERFDERLLPMDEIKNRLRDETFAALDGCPRYHRIRSFKHGEIFDGEPCTSAFNRVAFESSDGVEHCTANEWARYKSIEAAVEASPHALQTTLREHTATCPDCDVSVTRRSCMVTASRFGFTMSREYDLYGD